MLDPVWYVKHNLDPLWEDKCLPLLKLKGLMQQENLIHAKAQQSNNILYLLGEKLGEFREIWIDGITFFCA